MNPETGQLEVKRSHPHGEICESFKLAMDHGHILEIEGELQIQGRLPKGAKAGNVLTGEEYDPETFHLNIAISFCPFCGCDLRLIENVLKRRSNEFFSLHW